MWEVGLRLFWHNPYVDELPDKILKVPTHHPNSDHIINRGAYYPDDPWIRVRTGPRSYILPSFQYEKPDATIAFMGASTTAALAVHEEARFPILVSKLLAKEGLRVNVLNTARGSGTLHDSINIVLNHLVTDRPDIVVAMHSGTDQALLAGSGNYEIRMGQTVSVTDMARWTVQMLSSESYIAGFARRNMSRGSRRAKRGWASGAREGAPKVPVEAAPKVPVEAAPKVPVEEFEARLEVFVTMVRAFGMTPVLVTEPLAGLDENHDRFNEAIREVGAREGAMVIDLANHIERETPGWDTPMHVFYDGVHVSENGSRMYAEYIFERILPLVREVAD